MFAEIVDGTRGIPDLQFSYECNDSLSPSPVLHATSLGTRRSQVLVECKETSSFFAELPRA